MCSVVLKGQEKRIEIQAGKQRRQYKHKSARYEHETSKYKLRDRNLQHYLAGMVEEHFLQKPSGKILL